MINKKEDNQFSADHYLGNYDNIRRFISYFYQIDSVLKLKPKKVLEIGMGNKTVANYLKNAGLEVVTLDIDQELRPDFVGDVRKLPFEDNSFDLIIVCEVLEHIPFGDLEKALLEIKRVSKKHVIVSIPFSCMHFEAVFKIAIPFFSKQFDLKLTVPYFFLPMMKSDKNKDHYWEMGRKNYSKSKIKKIFRKYFKIKKEFSPIINAYHQFFIFENKDDQKI